MKTAVPGRQNGSGKQREKAGKHATTDEHKPIAHIEAEKSASVIHAREHNCLWSFRPGY